MVQFAVAGILTASTFPLRLIFYLAVPLLFSNFLMLFVCLLVPESIPVHFVHILNMMFLITAVTFIATYTARVYKGGIQRPIFVVD